MAKQIELRQYMRKFGMDDLRAGLQPIRQLLGAPGSQRAELFAPPVLQYRTRERVHVDGQPALQWSEWEDVMFVREGEAPAGEAPA